MKMYLVVSFLVVLASQRVLGSPIYFPDEVKIDDDGKGARLLPGIFFYPAPKDKLVPSMISFGVNEADKIPSLIMDISAKLERVKNTGEMEPFKLASDYVHQRDNDTSEIRPKVDYLENKKSNETLLLSLLDDEVQNSAYNTQDIVNKINVRSENNNTSIPALLHDVESEVVYNDSKNKSIREMDSDIYHIEMEIVTETDYFTTEISDADYITTEISTVNEPVENSTKIETDSTVNEPVENSTKIEPDSTLNEPVENSTKIESDSTVNEPMENSTKIEPDSTSNMDSESSVEILFFDDEKKKLADDIFIFPTSKNQVKLIPDEKAKIIQKRPNINRCLIQGEIHYQGECYPLLSSWPCGSEDKWLVMKGYDFAECEPRPCPIGQLSYHGKCVNPEDSSICAAGQMLYVEMTGTAYCDCDPGYIYFSQDGTCVPEYEQGWCPWGQYLVRNKDGTPECTRNPCGISGSVFHKKNKMCYKKNYVGYCEEDFIDIRDNVAECQEIEFIVALRNVFEVPTFRRCPKGSKRDILQECRRRFNMPSISSVLKARQLYGGCPYGWTKAVGRKCKKIINLFSSTK